MKEIITREFLLIKHAKILEKALEDIISHEQDKALPDYEVIALGKIALSNTQKDIIEGVT